MFRMTGPLSADFDVQFARGQPFEGLSVVPTLERLWRASVDLVDECERTFSRH